MHPLIQLRQPRKLSPALLRLHAPALPRDSRHNLMIAVTLAHGLDARRVRGAVQHERVHGPRHSLLCAAALVLGFALAGRGWAVDLLVHVSERDGGVEG